MFNRTKFKRLVHYVIAQAESEADFGAVKLNKVLWFSDARQHVLTGQSITGADYVRQEFGPVPKGIKPILAELSSEGKVRIYPQRQAYIGTRYASLVRPVDVGFERDEQQTVDYWIRHIARDHTAESISDESHDYAWEIAKMGEPLPYYAYIASRAAEPTEEDMEWARRSAQRLGLL